MSEQRRRELANMQANWLAKNERLEHLDRSEFAMRAAQANMEQAAMGVKGYESHVGTDRGDVVTRRHGLEDKIAGIVNEIRECRGMINAERERISEVRQSRDEMSTEAGRGHVFNGLSQSRGGQALDKIGISFEAETGQAANQSQEENPELGR